MADFNHLPTLPSSIGRQRMVRSRLSRPRSLSSMTARSLPTAPTPLSLFEKQSMMSAATDFFDAPEMPDVSELLSRGIPTRLELADMISRTSVDDVQRLPAIHPYVASARGETLIRYMSFVSRPAMECKRSRYRPRTIAVVPRLLGPKKCIKCQLRTEHITCEKHKYLRVGGGFRHSYYYIKKVLDAIEQNKRIDLEENRRQILFEQERQAAMLRAQAEARARADIAAMAARDKKKAKKLLGLKDDEDLEDFKSSKRVYEENEQGKVVKVKREDIKKMNRAIKQMKEPYYARDIASVESGIGPSIRTGPESRLTRYTVSRSRKVNFEDEIFDQSDGRSDVIEVKRNRKERKKEKKRREKILVPKASISPWDHQKQKSSPSSDSDSDDENDDSRRRRKKHKKKKKRKEKEERKKEKRRHRRRYSKLESEEDKGEVKESNPRRSRKEKREKRTTRDKSWSPGFGSDHFKLSSKKKTKKSRRKKISSDSDSSVESKPRRRRRKRKEKKAKSATDPEDSSPGSSSGSESETQTGTGSSDNSSNSNSSSSANSESGSSSDSSSSSTSTSSSSSTTSSLSSSSSDESSSSESDISDVSDPSSVGDVSDIEGNVGKEQRQIQMAEKKKQKFQMKKAEKKEKKIENRKVEKEVKKEEKIQKKIVKDKKKEEKRERKEVKRQEKKVKKQEIRRRKIMSSSSSSSSDPSVSDASVSSVHSDEISDVDETLQGEERQQAIEDKKAQVMAQKVEQAITEKKEEKKEEQKKKKQAKKQKKIKKAIAKEIELLSSPSSASSVHSSEMSDLEGIEDDDEKQKKKEEKKEEKKVVKMFKKAVAKVMGKGHDPDDWQYDDTIDDSGVVRGARKKKEFKYLLPKDDMQSMVKMGKGSKRGLTEAIMKTDGRGMEWFDDWQKKREEEKREKERLAKEGGGIDDEEFQNLLKSAQAQLEKDEKEKRKRVKRKSKLHVVDTNNDDDDDDDDETTSEVSEVRLRVRKERHVAKKEETEDVADDETGALDPPSSPSELGKIRGVRRVNRMFKEKPDVMKPHLEMVLDTASELQADKPRVSEDRDAERPKSNNSSRYAMTNPNIDFLTHYRLIEAPKLEPFGRAFVVEDDDRDCCLEYEEMRNALDGVQSLSEIRHKQIEYVLKVLDIDKHTKVTFKMFAVVAAVCERMCSMDPFGKYLVDQSDLMDIERKMSLYKAMFYCNINESVHGKNHVSAESIRIELLAGGLSWEQERYVMSKMNVNDNFEISFFDYMAYIPLFLSMHDNIIDNPLDMAEKYPDKNSPFAIRDMNPLGLPLKPEFLEAPKEINPSGIPLGSPSVPVVETEEQLETLAVPEDEEDRDSLDTGSLGTPPSERLPLIDSKPSSGRSTRTVDSFSTNKT